MPSGHRFVRFVCFVCAMVLLQGGLNAARLGAQGGSTKTALTGTVVDVGGGVIPGATVVVTNNATGVSTNTVTNADGAFNVPALDPGTYTVTVSLQGFKTSVIKDQRLVAASPTNVKVAIEVGSLAETVNVRAGSELVQTQSGAVSSTLSTEQLKTVPLPTRNALYAVNMLPGVDTVGTVRDSSIAGLPEQAINISLDGVNVNNNQDKAGDGFYAMVRPQLDAIEQVTLTTAAQGADSAGQGAVQIRFVTRSGTNTYRGTAYDYFRHPSLNSNSWINEKNKLPKNEIILHQAGFSQGGPIVIPGLFNGRNKAFFFFNYERFYQPTEATRTRTILNPDAQRGIFTYAVTEGGQTINRTVDVLDLARRNGQLSSLDPTTSALLNQVRAAASTTGTISTQPGATNTQQYVFLSPGKGLEHLPTTRVDFNLSERHRLSGTYYWQQVNRLPDIQNNGDSQFPGFPSRVNYLSHRTTGSMTLRSTLSSALVNELVGGWQDSPGYFASGVAASQYENQQGFGLVMPLGLSNATTQYGGAGSNVTGEDPRNTPNWNIDNTLSWQKGTHSFAFGGSFSQFRYTQTVFNTVPTINFGVQASVDPSDAMFTGGTTGNFPGASTGNLTDARALYALLTGRVTAINGQARLNDENKYVYLGRSSDRLLLNEIGTFVQDSWRITPALTINAGVRWEVQTPVVSLNSNYSTATVADICGPSGLGNGPGGRACNLFQPGVFNAAGRVSQYTQLMANERSFNTDWNNVAPNVSAAWRPNVQTGILRKVLGDPEQATVRAGFSIAYNRNGMAEFQGIFAGNPGRAINANRTNALGNLVPTGGTWPILLRETSRLGPPAACTSAGQSGCIPETVTYPLSATLNNGVAIFDPDIQLSRTKSYQIGFQRALTRDMAIEVRYVGNHNTGAWTTENWNEVNVYENGFLDEFKLAQANLLSHVAAGCGAVNNPCSFGYRGPGTGTSPLPIYLAHFTGRPASQAGTAANYSDTNFSNTTFVGRLNRYEPSAGGAADDLFNNATFRSNMALAGLPANFWVMNPLIGAANVRTDAGSSKYDSVQTEIRRRLSNGLLVNGSYTYARRLSSNLDSLHFPRYLAPTTVQPNVPHSFKFNAYYEAPFGRGKRFGANINRWVDGVIGGWTASATGRLQVQRLAIDNARLVGMTLDELQSEYKIRIDADKVVRMMPDDIILNSQRAFSTSATSADGYSALGAPQGRYIAPASYPGCVRLNPGDCGDPQNIFLTSPLFTRVDLSLKKQFALGSRRSVEITYDINNLFNNINFTPVFSNANLNSTTVFQTNAHYTDISQSYDPGGRLGQIIVRVNW